MTSSKHSDEQYLKDLRNSLIGDYDFEGMEGSYRLLDLFFQETSKDQKDIVLSRLLAEANSLQELQKLENLGAKFSSSINRDHVVRKFQFRKYSEMIFEEPVL